MARLGWEQLPDEILLQIISYLDPYHVSRLQLVSRQLQKFCLDNELWKRYCFDQSPWYQSLINRRAARRTPFVSLLAMTGTEVLDQSDLMGYDASSDGAGSLEQSATRQLDDRAQRLQDMVNWDPTFPTEEVSWYDEYIQREGPASINWLETPRMSERGAEAIIEAHGVALYSPFGGNDGLGTMLAVAPLEDGSVCLWDVKGTRGRQGAILTKSQPDILFIDGPGAQNKKRSKMIDSSIADRVSVDNFNHKAYIAVQSHLIEVDLNRLDVVSRESFEWSITTLSSVDHGVPMTVGTSLGIHLHDFRARAKTPHSRAEHLDTQQWNEHDVFKSIFDPKPLPPYASLSQPTPNSILHLPRPGSEDLVSDDIYVSGRFSNILHYDRRKFPAIAGSIYSGALINSMTALPYPFSTTDYEVRQQGDFTAEKVFESKAKDGRTLIAGGGYKAKGSLEIYGLSSLGNTGGRNMLQHSLLKNRHTAASSTILCVANHGTKIVFADGSGQLKWFERDGTTECRRLKIGHSEAEGRSTLFGSMPAADDVARKIMSTRTRHGATRPNNDNILFWTGEKLGMVSFTTSTLYEELDFMAKDPKAEADHKARREYSNHMRQALEQSADEARYLGRMA